MRKILNISATIRELSIGESFPIPFKDMTDHVVRNQAYRVKDKKYKVTVERDKLRTVVTRIS